MTHGRVHSSARREPKRRKVQGVVVEMRPHTCSRGSGWARRLGRVSASRGISQREAGTEASKDIRRGRGKEDANLQSEGQWARGLGRKAHTGVWQGEAGAEA